ncbi:MAG: amino acid adenylation domain-containing protein, partial [Paracoccaceae bacterium]|nr:amino acid adenylation domain-containing protein [Paracoccaceae bacterium]
MPQLPVKAVDPLGPIWPAFAAARDAAPDAPALLADGRHLTYRALSDAAERVAAHLMAMGVCRGDFVGLLASRSVDAVIAMFGVLRAGAAYVPLDPTHAPEQLPFIARDLPLRAALVADRWSDRAGDVLPETVPRESLDTVLRRDAALPAAWPEPRAEDVAYVMYTSGTTGQPKGVVVPQAGITAFSYRQPMLDVRPDDVVLHANTIACDGSTFDIFAPLLNGAACAVAEMPFPAMDELARVFTTHRVTMAMLYAGVCNLMIDHQLAALGTARMIYSVGDVISIPHARRLLDAYPEMILQNFYGPTEVTCITLGCRITAGMLDGRPLPIGRCLERKEAFVVDDDLTPLPEGARGQLVLGGCGVAAGYYNQPERTAASFIPDPRPGHDGVVYLTGDLVEMRPDGLYAFHGRADRQVKLGGRRIELDGIEHVLRQQPGVADAVVMVVTDRGGDRKIGALIHPADATAEPEALIRAVLHGAGEKLHPATLPKIVRVTTDWHLTPAGKVNRRAMLPQLEAAPAQAEPPAPASAAQDRDVKALVTEVWEEILGYSPIPQDATFFEAGGSSMQLIDAHSRIEARLGQHFDITLLFETPRLGDLAERLGRLAPAAAMTKPQADHDTDRDIAIVGLAGRFPGAPTLEAFWQHLRRGDNLIPRFSPEEMEDSFTPDERRSPHYVPARPILDGAEAFDAKFFGILPREAERMDPQARVFLELCSEALDDAAIDPARAGGRIGVWAGSSMSTYMLRNLMADRDGLHAFTSGYQISDYATLTGNLPDSLATRVAWKLDLKGPAMTVQTACSTSLTAIAQAVTALRGGLADVALAGGVSITFPQKRGYFAQEGGMGSTDGLCRPFDADASGTVFGHGAGVVVLKRLSDAQAAGDRILAVIKGVGLSNDGADKISYTAPSVTGQAEAIRAAIRDAGVAPQTISYVECHGTATPLGDPIEVAGLNQAFAGTPKSAVALGSVKGNIGHLDAAAGVMGVIKTTLMLQAREIPPVAHFKAPNPRIDFAASPFRVAAALQPWQSDGPLRAGVSAFGVGGTNAHVVLEEAPAAPVAAPAAAPQVLPLSAASPEALKDYAAQLARRLTAPDAPALADVAFTLQEGRRRFGYRLALAARSAPEAAEALRAARMPETATPARRPKTVFMFPGQGSQYPGMGRGLYQSEPVFASVIDAGVEILKPLIDTDLARLLCYADVSDEDAARALRETRLTQPALCLTEVATARLWQARGVVPDAMIGHSVGEFAAAVIAGVMSFEDALRIIAARGRLMQSQPAGAMLSVRATVEALTPFLHGGAELAACNAPNLQVVAGPDAAIAALAERLQAAGIVSSRLHTSHAFHSAMMDPVVPALQAAIENLTLKAPVLPIISTVTGRKMTAAEAQDPAYWAAQARATVDFQTALKTAADEVSETGTPVFIEVGAGRTLSAFAGQTLKRGGHGGIIQSLPDHTQTGQDDSTVMAAAFANLWAAGAEVDFARLPRGARRVSLPPHPFLRKRYWVEPAKPSEPPESRHDGVAFAQQTAALPALPQSDPTKTDVPVQPLPQEAKMTLADRKPRLTTALLALFGNISGDDLTEADAGTPFLELGFDSLFMAQAATAITKDYGVEVPFRAMLTDHPSVAALADHLDAILPPDPQVAEAPAAPVAVPAQAAAPLPAPQAAPAVAPAVRMTGDLSGVLQAQMATMQAVFADQLRALGTPMALPTAAEPTPPPSAPVPLPVAAQPAPVAAAAAVAVAKPADPKPEGGFKLGRGPNVSGAVLTDQQKTFVADLARRYSERHAASKAYTERYRDVLADPRTAAGFHPDWKELTFPIVADRSKGAHIWDLDGNRFVDVVNGFGQTAFGHSPDFVSEAVVKQLEKGYAIGPQADRAGPIAERLAKYLGHDRVTFCNTGSEAVLAALRAARTVTGRNRIALFSGSY